MLLVKTLLLGPRGSQGRAQVALIALIPALLGLTAPSGGTGARLAEVKLLSAEQVLPASHV